MENDTLLALYGDTLRCESCSGLRDWNGVREFAERGPGQTLPVSHFGKISTAKIWLISFNPANDRNDPNVGLTVAYLRDLFQDRIDAGEVAEFTCRHDLPDAAVEEAIRHFGDYAFGVEGHDYFKPWHKTLNGLSLDNEALTFENGGICVVDAIKCPTRLNIGGWHGEDAKAVARNCGKKGNRFLIRQIAFHDPQVVIFAGTQTLVPAADRGRPSRRLLEVAGHVYVKMVRSSEPPWSRRLYIELDGAKGVKSADPTGLRGAFQRIITAWDAGRP